MKPNNAAGEIASWINSAEPTRVFSMEAALRLRMAQEPKEPKAEQVFCFPLLTRWGCEKIIEAAETAGEWRRSEGDAYPGEEMKFSDISTLFDSYFRIAFCAIANTYLAERYVKYRITPDTMESPFIVKYTAGEGIQEMDVHNDGLSEITFSIPLNEEYQGSGLHFALAEVPGLEEGWHAVGEALCFPGGPTHEHYVPPITSGTRYSLTIWTRGV